MKRLENFYLENGWFMGNAALGGPLQLAFKQGEFPFSPAHHHARCHEYFIVLNGDAELTVNDLQIQLKPGSVIVVEPGEIHSLDKQSKDFSLLLLMDSYEADDTFPVTPKGGPDVSKNQV